MSYRLLGIQGKPDPFTPYYFQGELLEYLDTHSREHPARAMCIWPRRHGKDLTALHKLAEMAHDRVGAYWHVFPTYEQARKACWNAFRTDTGQRLMDNVFPREIIRRPKEWSPSGEMLVELHNGSIIQFIGSDEIDTVVGAGPAGVNGSEFALWRPSAIDYIRPMLRESGGFLNLITTPRGHNHAFKLHQIFQKNPRAFTSHRTIYNAGKYTREQADNLLAEERAEGMLEELIRQEYFCDWDAALVGSYWGDLLPESLISEFNAPGDVYTTWDLGINDATAIWIWGLNRDGVDFVDFYQSHSKGLPHYAEVLERLSRERGYKYKKHFVPHDAKARTFQTGVSTLEQMVEAFGHGMVKVVPKLAPLDGIQAGRWLLQKPVRFHKRCEKHDGIEALRTYHRKWDEDKKVFDTHPEHDWSSHAADAFRYTALTVKTEKMLADNDRKRAAAPYAKMPQVKTIVTLDEMWPAAKSFKKRVRA